MPLPYGAKVVRGDFAESWRDLLVTQANPPPPSHPNPNPTHMPE